MEDKKKSLKMPIIILVAVLVILLIGAIFYATKSSKPKDIFIGAIDSLLDTSKVNEEIKTENLTVGLGININSENNEMKKVAEYLNKTKFTANIQTDLEQEKQLVKLGIDYDNEKVLDAKLFYKSQEDNMYARVEELFDKPFALKLDEENKEQVKAMFEELKTLYEGEKLNKVIDIVKNSISNRLKDEYFSQENVGLDIDGKSVETRKSVLTLQDIQLQELISDIVADLRDNEEFLNCFKEEDREKIRTTLNDFKENANQLASEIVDSTFKLNIYTRGINQKFVKFEIVLTNDISEYIISILRTDSENYKISIAEKYNEENESKEILTGNITIKDIKRTSKDITIKLNTKEIGEISFNVQISNVINKNIEDMDTSNSVDVENLTKNDQEKIMTNLQGMKIYTIVQEVIGDISQSVNGLYNY